jgi:hypothetical protein
MFEKGLQPCALYCVSQPVSREIFGSKALYSFIINLQNSEISVMVCAAVFYHHVPGV